MAEFAELAGRERGPLNAAIPVLQKRAIVARSKNPSLFLCIHHRFTTFLRSPFRGGSALQLI
jgi:hypothetical protein